MPSQGQKAHKQWSQAPYLKLGTGRTWAIYPPTEARLSTLQLQATAQRPSVEVLCLLSIKTLIHYSTQTHGGKHRDCTMGTPQPKASTRKRSTDNIPKGR